MQPSADEHMAQWDEAVLKHSKATKHHIKWEVTKEKLGPACIVRRIPERISVFMRDFRVEACHDDDTGAVARDKVRCALGVRLAVNH